MFILFVWSRPSNTQGKLPREACAAIETCLPLRSVIFLNPKINDNAWLERLPRGVLVDASS